ncbi:hypothetical protein COCON_G00122630 [Conger conger]|uniref:Glycosyltransferase 2-like domain-containing protein n=1 Tax=Conger conger TaxID=82655 RepID=A0A9Q1DH85_CONCO|nr:hypothetical protein COCON_G00122630 [Conger conger]
MQIRFLGESLPTVPGDCAQITDLRIQRGHHIVKTGTVFKAGILSLRRAFTMKRRQKRVLQFTFLFMVALIFLPNIGLWSLYKDKRQIKSPETGEQGFVFGPSEGHVSVWTDGLRRRDWHDSESIRRDEMRVGKGEQGKPYPLAEDECDDSAYKENGFNIYVSNNIALDRSLPDIRHPNCKQKRYLENLPNTSIIIPFHNEGWSSLLRTIHSIVNRTPDHLIAEIVLVDDFSDRERKDVVTALIFPGCGLPEDHPRRRDRKVGSRNDWRRQEDVLCPQGASAEGDLSRRREEERNCCHSVCASPAPPYRHGEGKPAF